MLTSLAWIFLVGLAAADICKRIHLPRMLGMLATGMVLGPYVLNALDSSVLSISPELRKMALVIILLKAGLSLNLQDLKKVGRPALLLSFVPASFEILGYFLLAPKIFGIGTAEALLMGAVLSAVSPAVVVPRMVQLMEEKYGTREGIPQMILAGSSLDDVFVLVLFTTFLGMAQGAQRNFWGFADVPISIMLGLLLGVLCGWLLSALFEKSFQKNRKIRNSTKILILLSVSFLLLALENALKGKLAFSGMLAILSLALVLAMHSTAQVTGRLQEKFGKLWIAAEILLFVLVGAAVDIRYTLTAGWRALLLLLAALVFRSLGVYLSLLGTKYTAKEKWFCIFAYLPKATVQAAIGGVPLALGLPCGKLILSVAVLAILVTAPLGAILMDATYTHFLKPETA